jgi:hypothetical protein
MTHPTGPLATENLQHQKKKKKKKKIPYVKVNILVQLIFNFLFYKY